MTDKDNLISSAYHYVLKLLVDTHGLTPVVLC
jgi:hypothetical protein